MPPVRFTRNGQGRQRPGFIAMTAYATQSNWEQCLEAGMDDYISKPIQIANHLCPVQVVSKWTWGAGELGGRELVDSTPSCPALCPN